MVFTLALAVISAVPVAAALSPAVPATPPPPPSFARDVAPILDRYCVSCHGEKEAQGGLRLDSFEAALQGGEDGPVIVQGDPAGSQLLAQIERRARPAMPPKRRLPQSPVATIRAWILAGTPP